MKVLFSPGIEKPRSKIEWYLPLLDAIETGGYEVEFVETTWSGYTLDQKLDSLRRRYIAHDPVSTILAGFSLGAWLSTLVAAEVSPQELWLFSLSGAYREDLALTPEGFRSFMGKSRLEFCSRYSFAEIAPRIQARRTWIFAGTEELSVLRNRCMQAARQISNAQLIEIPGMKHSINHPALLTQVREVLT